MATYIQDDIEYTNIQNPQVNIGTVISNSKYVIDNNQLVNNPLPLINAIDINWGGANILDTEINTTSDLLNLIQSGLPSSGGSDVTPTGIISAMLTAIYALQNEVQKLRNSFRFGINSYTEDNFGMSQTVDELSDVTEEEPLWAVDETELSFIDGLDLSNNDYDLITPPDNYSILPNDKLEYSNTINWTANINNSSIFSEITDSKIYIYITSSSKNVIFHLTTNDETFDINVNNIVTNNYKPDKYNILLIISRQVKIDETHYGSHNFAWLSVSEWGTGADICNGYINANGLIDFATSQTPIYYEQIYNLDSIDFVNESGQSQYLYKLDVYSKYQDFSSTVEAATPTNVEDYKYRTASLTIRSISTLAKLEQYTKQYQNNELIFCEENKKLYIYSNGTLINIGTGGSEDNPNNPISELMEAYEIIKALEEQGLLTINFVDSTIENNDAAKYDESNIASYILNSVVQVNDVENIKFINHETGRTFNVKMNPYGQFDIKETSSTSLEEQMTRTETDGTKSSIIDDFPEDFKSDRSFVSLFNWIKSNKALSITGDMKLNADHVRIGAIYAPFKSDTIFGCSHGYIELVNTSDKDFYLDGCYLHYSAVDNATASTVVDDVRYYKLALDGYIPAGGTYLVRCKKYVTLDDDINTFIHVNSFDKEWYVDGELLDLSMVSAGSYGFALTYGDTVNGGRTLIGADTNFTMAYNKNDSTYTAYSGKGSYMVRRGFIDSLYLGKDWGNIGHWIPYGSQGNIADIQSNAIYKVTFELDPAKQAFNSMTTTDSSRARWKNRATDYQIVDLANEYIVFPKTTEKKAVADYTPKASYEHKNVISDKSKLDKTKPNAIVCSFGINPYTTRCFNWISSGSFNEAVVLIHPTTGKEYIFESFKNKNVTDKSKYGTYTRETIGGIHWTQEEIDAAQEGDDAYGKTVNDWKVNPQQAVYTVTETIKPSTDASKYPAKHEFDPYINNIVYGSGYVIKNYGKESQSYEYGLETANVNKRLYNHFPGNNEAYTSHKCIIDVVKDAVDEPQTWQYYICRLDRFGKKDTSYKSDIRTFTLYPDSYQPRIYQITDQQGFHWIEYQVWAAAAEKLNHQIEAEIWNHSDETNPAITNRTTPKGIMPIIINTGDAVQSGARVNEWLDYFNAGEYLFDHFEQMNVVGNNDLCDTNVNALGTGDDVGKSNGYFYHLFNCYEVPAQPTATFIYTISPDDGETLSSITYEQKTYMPIIKDIYVPSTYYMDVMNGEEIIRLLFINSEITTVNCRDWFMLRKDNNKSNPVNIYTGFTINMGVAGYEQTYEAHNLQFTPIYDILYNWTSTLAHRTYLPICHEMPFTVVTNACLRWLPDKNDVNQYERYRSLSDAQTGALIGSHCNQIEKSDNGKGMHWLSRLFEYRRISLCLGGHKHTYACTYPVRENYIYTDNGVTKYSYTDGPMPMEQTLENDSAIWTLTNESTNKLLNLSKFPIVKRNDAHKKLDETSETETLTYPNEATATIKVIGADTKENPTRFFPCIDAQNNDTYPFVIYLMCQATGYKLTSNKELPSEYQKFSMVIPKSYIEVNQDGTASDKPSGDQQSPMFTIIDLAGNNKYYAKLGRLVNISSENNKMIFTQLKYGKNATEIQYLIMASSSLNGIWCKYNLENNNYIQTDVHAQSKVDLGGSTFTASSNNNQVLYTNLLNNEDIYLFVIDDGGNMLDEI